MQRRNFIKTGSVIGTAGFLQSGKTETQNKKEKLNDRDYWVQMLTKIAYPVLHSLSESRLKQLMPVEAKNGTTEDRRKVTYLEALGRTLAGLAPWLEAGEDNSNESRLRNKFIQLAVASIKNAVTPSSPDYMNFTEHKQPLVDAAFLAHALLRAPKQLWGNLDDATKQNLIHALASTRVIEPYQSNWLLFSAMIETALFKFTGTYKEEPVRYALQQHEAWYKGDAMYGDGTEFAFDYYNSFVMHPMMLDIVQTLPQYADKKGLYLKRSQRYAEILERLISPEGTYPPAGRSIAYRCGAFHLLAQLALHDQLPTFLPPAQVRSALTAVIKKSMEAPGTFDNNGWLTIGFCGHQPGIGETYISTGSLYLCTLAFLPLGLPVTHTYWANPSMEWTSVKAYSGKDFPIDHALKQ